MAKANRLYLEKGSLLADAVNYVFDPNTNAIASSATKHVYFQQCAEDSACVLGQAQADTWIYREFPCQGIVGFECLLDAEDIVNRIGSVEAWKNSSICMQGTKQNKIKFSSIAKVESDNSIKTDSNILINTYHGDLNDFVRPPNIEWKTLCLLTDGWLYKTLTKNLIKFSGLRTSPKDKCVWFRFDGKKLSVVSAEKGDRVIGQSLIRMQIDCLSNELSFGIPGRYLQHTGEVIEGEARSITIEVDNIDNPSYVRFKGNTGWIITKLRDEFQSNNLAILESKIFRSEDTETEDYGFRTFLLPQLKAGVAKQAPKKGCTSDNLLLDIEEDILLISKRDDMTKEESSLVPIWSTDYEGDWEPLIVLHSNISEVLDNLDSYLNYATKSLNEADPSSLYRVVRLTIKRIYNKKKNKYGWRFFIQHPSYPQLSFSENANTRYI